MYLFGLVNNAGVGLVGPVESISIDDMKRVFETNFFGTVRMIKAVLPEMKLRQRGHIVVISSVMGLQGEYEWHGEGEEEAENPDLHPNRCVSTSHAHSRGSLTWDTQMEGWHLRTRGNRKALYYFFGGTNYN